MIGYTYIIIFDTENELHNYTEKLANIGNVVVLQKEHAICVETKKFPNKVDVFKEITRVLIDCEHYFLYNANEEKNNDHSEDNPLLQKIINFLILRNLI